MTHKPRPPIFYRTTGEDPLIDQEFIDALHPSVVELVRRHHIQLLGRRFTEVIRSFGDRGLKVELTALWAATNQRIADAHATLPLIYGCAN